MYLGPKSADLLEEALEINPHAPLVQKLYGNLKFFTPENYGGNVNEAITAYKKAIALYEKNKSTRQNWFYLDTLVLNDQSADAKNLSCHDMRSFKFLIPEKKRQQKQVVNIGGRKRYNTCKESFHGLTCD